MNFEFIEDVFIRYGVEAFITNWVAKCWTECPKSLSISYKYTLKNTLIFIIFMLKSFHFSRLGIQQR